MTLAEIDNFFKDLSPEEFERLALESGLGEIKESCDCSYIKAFTYPTVSDKEEKSNVYLHRRESISSR